MSSSDLTTLRHTGASEGERFASAAEAISSEQVHAAPTPSAPSRVSILLGSIGFGVIFLLAWQFAAAGPRRSVLHHSDRHRSRA